MAISQPFKVAWRPMKAMSIGRGLLPFATSVPCRMFVGFMLRDASPYFIHSPTGFDHEVSPHWHSQKSAPDLSTGKLRSARLWCWNVRLSSMCRPLLRLLSCHVWSVYIHHFSPMQIYMAHAICDESQPCWLLYEDIKRMESKYHEGVAASVIVRKDGPSLS